MLRTNIKKVRDKEHTRRKTKTWERQEKLSSWNFLRKETNTPKPRNVREKPTLLKGPEFCQHKAAQPRVKADKKKRGSLGTFRQTKGYGGGVVTSEGIDVHKGKKREPCKELGEAHQRARGKAGAAWQKRGGRKRY